MKTALVTGGLTYAAARYIFDSSTTKALAWAAVVAVVGYYIANLQPSHPLSVDNTPQV